MKNNILLLLKELDSLFPNANSELNFKNNYELIVSVVLSAQCTDKQVNKVTKNLFDAYPTPYSLGNANITDVENIIKSCGFYHNKAKNIIKLSKDIYEKYGGIVPSEFNDLITLSGVGQKTANVVLSAGFNKDAIAVDTHVLRVSNRLGLAKTSKPNDCEEELKQLIPKNLWGSTHFKLVLFGRNVCNAKKPNCQNCNLKTICQFYQSK